MYFIRDKNKHETTIESKLKTNLLNLNFTSSFNANDFSCYANFNNCCKNVFGIFIFFFFLSVISKANRIMLF